MYTIAKDATLWILFLTAALMAGCAGEEYTYVDSTELQPGPGLLSGDDGVFTISVPQGSSEKESSPMKTTGKKE